MTNLKLALAYGFLVWLIPFAVAFAIFPIHASDRIFFESIMPIVVVLAVVIFAVLYGRKVKSIVLEEWVKLGVLWLAVSVAIDLLMFSWGPMKMSLADYFKDIGFTYLMIPIISAGFGYLKK
ncbi:MAG: hypothetical protein A2653_00055 [Candidatus Zambryskibacteria bacterium RIFCSPHIGHO2_01_FULL_43_25]|nr:MAG: hypothetical protein A2653_00055 [Candidatus Zambryskibacteria bacterium RIFCSPHIGHO2_01_FULL_43_25]